MSSLGNGIVETGHGFEIPAECTVLAAIPSHRHDLSQDVLSSRLDTDVCPRATLCLNHQK